MGGASGIGLETVKHFLSLEAKVAVLDISLKGLKAVLADFDLPCVEGDVRNVKDIQKIIELMNKKWKGIDIFIYSAGIYPDRLIIDMTEEEWDRVIDTNLKGAFLASREVSKVMMEQGKGGRIITISSGSYQSARIGSAHYCASKGGLVMLTKVLALVLANYNIQVNSVSPGLVESDVLDPRYIEQFSKRIPLGRPAKKSEVSSFIEMIVSSENEYLTGQILALDGGLSAGHYGLPQSNST